MADVSSPWWLAILGDVLLFFIFFGLTGDVDLRGLLRKFTDSHQRRGLLAGVIGQFLILPLLGFLVVKAFRMPDVQGITLLVVASSPGGAFSNWWCSMYNADLALSIAMTTTSTLLSLVFLPLNTFLYITLAFGVNVPIHYSQLAIAVVIVLAGTGSGVTLAHYVPRARFVMHCVGNGAALLSLVGSMFLSGEGAHTAPVWHRPLAFYLPITTMCVLGLLCGLLLATAVRLAKPERVALTIEIMYQNVAIAAGSAVTMFARQEDVADAIGVPLYYGAVSGTILVVFCNVMWKCGWTLAPASAPGCVRNATLPLNILKTDPLWRVLLNSYQPTSEPAAGAERLQTYGPLDADYNRFDESPDLEGHVDVPLTVDNAVAPVPVLPSDSNARVPVTSLTAATGAPDP